MKRVLTAVSLGVAVLMAPVVVHAQTVVPASEIESTRLWFVELSGAPVADGNTLAAVQAEKAAFRKAAKAAGLRYSERRAFDTLFNGFSIEADPAERTKLARLAGVKAVYPVELMEAPKVERADVGSVADMASAIAMTGVNVAHAQYGLTGAGVKVGIIDSGVDIDHPDFGGTGVNGATPFPNARITHGWDFVGDAFNGGNTPTQDNRPDDCGGHGTHVAGIVGANGTVKGVAPGVTFGAYRVFGCGGSTTADIMLAAMERAAADGMHVVNMSIGSSFQWPQYPTAQAADRLVKKGVTVVASIGNSGANGLYAAGAPGVGKKVIGVASFENSHISLPQFTVSPDNAPIGYSQASGSPAAPTSGSAEMARTGTPSSTADGCSPLPAGSLAGKVALIRRGTCAFYDKAFNAQNAGAIGVVLYNNAPGRISPTVAGTPAITIPVVSVSDTEGVLINNRLALGPVTMTWAAGLGKFTNPLGGRIATSSSYGLAGDLSLKPNIGAPGAMIYSTYPLEAGGFATLSGTSMSSPHVAGIAALLLQARPNTPASGMMARLQNVADPKAWQGNPALGFLDQVHRQGAGMADIVGALQAKALVEPSELSLGESEGGPATRSLNVRNTSNAAQTYTLSHVPALATGPNSFTVQAFNAPATVAFAADTITVAAGATATVQVTITAPTVLAERSLYGGYLVLTPADGGEVLRVPYAGMTGNYQSVTVLTPTANGFPWLARPAGDGNYTKVNAGGSFTMVAGDLPSFLLHLDHQAERVRFEAFGTDGTAWGRISDDRHVARNSTAGGAFAYSWDGTTFDGKGKNANQWRTVPNGDYFVRLSVLKPLGDEANPAHWEIWESPVFTIARP